MKRFTYHQQLIAGQGDFQMRLISRLDCECFVEQLPSSSFWQRYLVSRAPPPPLHSHYSTTSLLTPRPSGPFTTTRQSQTSPRNHPAHTVNPSPQFARAPLPTRCPQRKGSSAASARRLSGSARADWHPLKQARYERVQQTLALQRRPEIDGKYKLANCIAR